MIGQGIILGSGQSTVLAALFDWTGNLAADPALVGQDTSAVGAKVLYDSGYFSYSNGTLTCKRAGTYTVTYYARGGYTSSGAARNCTYAVLHNGTSVANGAIGNAGTLNTAQLALASGDTVAMQFYSPASAFMVRAGYTITV